MEGHCNKNGYLIQITHRWNYGKKIYNYNYSENNYIVSPENILIWKKTQKPF